MAGELTTVLFCPEDLLILKTGAEKRRKLLDNALCQLRPGYAKALAEYQRLFGAQEPDFEGLAGEAGTSRHFAGL